VTLVLIDLKTGLPGRLVEKLALLPVVRIAKDSGVLRNG
jgi:hypothetical protein